MRRNELAQAEAALLAAARADEVDYVATLLTRKEALGLVIAGQEQLIAAADERLRLVRQRIHDLRVCLDRETRAEREAEEGLQSLQSTLAGQQEALQSLQAEIERRISLYGISAQITSCRE